MTDASKTQRDLSARRIIGFACNQAFVFFSLFNTGMLTVPFDRFDLIVLLLFMVLGFSLVRLLGPARFNSLFARPLLYLYAVLAGCGSLVPLVDGMMGVAAALARGLLVGVPSALLLTAWGRAFNREASRDSVPEVFLGSLVAALVCLVFSFSTSSFVVLAAVCILPLAGVVNIDISATRAADDAAPDKDEGVVTNLSIKILLGTLLFGVAAGLMVMSRSAEGAFVLSDYRVSIVLYGAFLIGSLSLLLSDGFGRGAALNKSYRLAVFVMMMGVLLVPWPLFATSLMPGEAVVMAGYQGLVVVFISLFLVLAEINNLDSAWSFSVGFQALFAGELIGAALATAAPSLFPGLSLSYASVVLAGAIILIGYIFLFTERDFDDLTQLVTESDSFEQTCAHITETYGLSKRESEILSYALRGRTSERIAQELVISKSTVDTHLRRIYAKCGVHSRQELIDLME